MISSVKNQCKIILCLLACLFILMACGKAETIVIDNVNMPSYMGQLNGTWYNTDDVNTNYSKLVFTSNDDGTYTMEVTDNTGVTSKETLSNIIENNDYMKTYSIEVDGAAKYSFYMTDSNNIVFENNKMQKLDEYFDSCFASLEGSWINSNGVKVTFFTNKNTRYVNLTDGFGTFNKRIFDIDKATDGSEGNFIMTKEGTNFISFYYNLEADGTLTFYDYKLSRNEDTSDYEALKVEEIPEESADDTSTGYDLTTYGTTTGYQIADCSNDIPTDTAYIFVGDSRFVGMDMACNISAKSNQYVVAKVSMGYHWMVNDAIKQVDEIIATHSASSWVVIFNFGINDLGNISKYKSFYSGLASKPYKVVLVSVNPVGNYPSIPNSTVEGFNMQLKETGFTYIDTYSYLMNERGYVSPDGLHYANSTYQDIYKYIIYSVKGIQISDADKQALDDQYHNNSISNNSASDNSASNNSASNNEAATNNKTYTSIEEYYADSANSVEFSNKIQDMKSKGAGIFSNITITVTGNTIIYNYIYEIDVPEVDWDATDNQLNTKSQQDLQELHKNSGFNGAIKIGYIYYDKNGNSIHSYYNEG